MLNYHLIEVKDLNHLDVEEYLNDVNKVQHDNQEELSNGCERRKKKKKEEGRRSASISSLRKRKRKTKPKSILIFLTHHH